MINLTNENYQQEVVDYKGKVVIDVWANWCGICKMMKPKFEELAKSHTDYKFCTMDADKCTEIVTSLNISNIPTFIIIDCGKEVTRGNFDVLGAL